MSIVRYRFSSVQMSSSPLVGFCLYLFIREGFYVQHQSLSLPTLVLPFDAAREELFSRSSNFAIHVRVDFSMRKLLIFDMNIHFYLNHVPRGVRWTSPMSNQYAIENKEELKTLMSPFELGGRHSLSGTQCPTLIDRLHGDAEEQT